MYEADDDSVDLLFVGVGANPTFGRHSLAFRDSSFTVSVISSIAASVIGAAVSTYFMQSAPLFKLICFAFPLELQFFQEMRDSDSEEWTHFQDSLEHASECV